MKSDVIRKRSRHDARRAGNAAPETPSASPGASRRPSPAPECSPTLAPDSTTQMTYDYHEPEYSTSQSELTGALGHEAEQNMYSFNNAFSTFNYASFPGPYHPDFLNQQFTLHEALPFPNVDTSDIDTGTVHRTNKRRRMSVDSASEPPSSAASFCSYNDGYSSQSSATTHSQRSSMEFPFSYYSSPTILRGSANTFWHPPMLPQEKNQAYVHPPMLPTSEESPMDYLHPPMLPQDEESLFSAYLHPPMLPPDENHHGQMNNNLHPPMLFPNDSVYVHSDYYDMMQTF
jgi:GATA-binding protein, other eukaryote